MVLSSPCPQLSLSPTLLAASDSLFLVWNRLLVPSGPPVSWLTVLVRLGLSRF